MDQQYQTEKEEVYEVTDLRLDPFLAEDDSERLEITVEELLGPRAILLRNVFSPKECQFYIDQAERLGLKPIEAFGYRATYRNNDRLVAMNEEIAQKLFERTRPFLQQHVSITDANEELHHLGTKGEWELAGVNECFRLCRYLPGGHFSPHYDGEFVRKPTQRSLKTYMIYLNGDFEGGTTNFLEDGMGLSWDPLNGKYVAQKEGILFRVKPEAGMAIVFDHKILHEGAAVEKGLKYIMRTEAMYNLVDRQLSPVEEQFHMLIQQAQKLESLGQSSEAVKLYQKASKLHPGLARIWGM